MSPLTRGWVVTFAGLGINLALGILYVWSVIAQVLVRPAAQGGQHLWTPQQANLPYAVAIVSFAIAMVLAGRLQDRIGPRWVATTGGVLVGLGMIVSSLSPIRLASASAIPFRMVLGFGVLTGAGIGFAYAAATPAASKWFSASKRGLVAGIVLSGFGFASMYSAPMTTRLIALYGVNESFLFLGVVYFVAIAGLAQLLSDPPHGYVPPGTYSEERGAVSPRPAAREYPWQDTVRMRSFWVMWAMYACAAFAGLMLFGLVARTGAARLGAPAATVAGYTLVAALALGNGIGRPVAGFVSDRFGRQHTLLGVLVAEAALILSIQFATSSAMLAAMAFLVGSSYGAAVTMFPVTTFDFYGTKNAGANYGLLFTAWGVGGVLGAEVAMLVSGGAASGALGGLTSATVLDLAAALCALAACLTFFLRPPDPGQERCPVAEPGSRV